MRTEIEKTSERIKKAIKRGSFAFERYLVPRTYYGVEISVMPLHCSYGQIGWVVMCEGKDIITYDYEMNKLTDHTKTETK